MRDFKKIIDNKSIVVLFNKLDSEVKIKYLHLDKWEELIFDINELRTYRYEKKRVQWLSTIISFLINIWAEVSEDPMLVLEFKNIDHNKLITCCLSKKEVIALNQVFGGDATLQSSSF